jgi:hypothetical protein
MFLASHRNRTAKVLLKSLRHILAIEEGGDQCDTKTIRMEPSVSNQSPRIDSKEPISKAVSLAGRYHYPIPTRFLAPVDCLKIPAQVTDGGCGGRGMYKYDETNTSP